MIDRIRHLGLGVLLLLILAACGSTTSTPAVPTTAPAAPDAPTVAPMEEAPPQKAPKDHIRIHIRLSRCRQQMGLPTLRPRLLCATAGGILSLTK